MLTQKNFNSPLWPLLCNRFAAVIYLASERRHVSKKIHSVMFRSFIGAICFVLRSHGAKINAVRFFFY